MEDKQTVISAAGEAFAECPEQTPAEEQPAHEPQPEQPQESPEQEHLVTLSLPRVIELLAAEKALAFLQAHEPHTEQPNPIHELKNKLELESLLHEAREDKQRYYDDLRMRSRIRKIHKRLQEPDAAKYIG